MGTRFWFGLLQSRGEAHPEGMASYTFSLTQFHNTVHNQQDNRTVTAFSNFLAILCIL